MFRFAFSSRARAACFGCAVALVCFADVSSARAAWPLESDAEVLLGYAADYTRDGRQTVHTGLDLAAEPGQSVLSPVAGQVSFAGRVPAAEGTMLAVTIQTDDGLRVTLMPLSATSLTVGRVVGVDDVVGQLAGVGDVSSAETHLHVGVRRAEHYLDPLSVLSVPAAAPVENPAPVQGGIEPTPVQAEPPVSEAISPHANGETVVHAAQQQVVRPSSPEFVEESLQARSSADAISAETPASVILGVATPLERVQAAGPVSSGADMLPGRTQTFRDAHVIPIADPAAPYPSEKVMAGAALLGAGLLALWPLWRGKRHPVPDVRPEINDVAAAVSR